MGAAWTVASSPRFAAGDRAYGGLFFWFFFGLRLLLLLGLRLICLGLRRAACNQHLIAA